MLGKLVEFLEFFQMQTLIFEKSKEPTIHLVNQGYVKMKNHGFLYITLYWAWEKEHCVTALDVVYALKRQGKTLYGFGG